MACDHPKARNVCAGGCGVWLETCTQCEIAIVCMREDCRRKVAGESSLAKHSGWGAHRELSEAKEALAKSLEEENAAIARRVAARSRYEKLLLEMSKKLCEEEPDLAQAVANGIRSGREGR